MYQNNNQQPKLSIILPTYNRQKYLDRSINSIIHQTFTDWELIIVDDGSTDQSLEICKSFSQQDARIKVFHTENFGVSHARNVGLDKASGEWFAFIDSDDEYLPDAFEMMLRYSDDADIVMSAALYKPFYWINGISCVEPTRFTNDSTISVECLKNNCYNPPWSKIFRSSAIQLRFDESMQKAEDFVFVFEAVSKASYIIFVPYITYFYYGNSDLSLCFSFHISQLYCSRRSYETTLKYLDNENVRKFAIDRFASSCIYYLANISFNKNILRTIIETIIQEQFNENIMPHLNNLKQAVPDPQYESLWQTILRGYPKEIIDECEKQQTLFIFNKTDNKNKDKNNELLEMNKFYISIAGLTIEIKHRFNFIKDKCNKYLVNNPSLPDIKTYALYQKIEYSKQYRLNFDGEKIDDDEAEFAALPQRFYGNLAKFNAFWLHAVVIEKDGVAYAFTAKPGTGKSTHGKLWLQAFPDAHIIDGDNPIIRLNTIDGKFYAYGTPFCGKEGYNENRGVPLKAVCFLERGEVNEIHQVSSEFVLTRLMIDNYCIDETNGELHFQLYKKLIEKTAFYSLNCNMEPEAALVAYKGMQ